MDQSIINTPALGERFEVEREVGRGGSATVFLAARSDLYSLGCLLFELLIGRVPYRGPNALSIIAQHLAAPPPDLLIDGVPRARAVATIVRRLLAKDRRERPATASDLLESLRC